MAPIDLDSFSASLKQSFADGYIAMMYETFLYRIKPYISNKACGFAPYKHVGNIISDTVQMTWAGSLTEKFAASYNNKNQTTDFASMFAALAIISSQDKIKEECQISSFCFETSATGSGIDFWISDDGDQLNYRARVEVSGIANETKTNTSTYRSTQKLKQVKKSNYTGIPVFITIIEFSKQTALVLHN